jgi:predicted nucleotidyltransferase
MMTTAEQFALIEAIRQALAPDDDIEAGWLAGSLGRGKGDAFSDVDVLVLVADDKLSDVIGRYAHDVSAIAQPVLVNRLYGGRVLNVVTVDWRRFDLTFVEARELGRYDTAALSPLFNKSGREPPRRAAIPYQTTPDQVLALVNEFLRVLGLLVVGIGREEYVLGLTGVDLLRRVTFDLMLEENGVGPIDRGGALHRKPLLAPDQYRQLEALPPVSADRAGIITAHIALADLFLPRARALVERVGAAWPEAFEAATRRHLQDRLGVSFAAASGKPAC